VLKSRIPSILVETAFIQQIRRKTRLNARTIQEKIARAILRGIKDTSRKIPRYPARPSRYRDPGRSLSFTASADAAGTRTRAVRSETTMMPRITT